MSKKRDSGQARRRVQLNDDGTNYIRSRTISGYDPGNDFKEPAPELERARVSRQMTQKRRRMYTLIALLAVIGLTLFAASQFVANVSSVSYGDSVVRQDFDQAYLGSANQYLSEHPSERFGWGFRSSAFSESMVKSHPEIESAFVSNQIFAGAKLEIKLRQPVAVWRSASNNNYVDADGHIFQTNLHTEPEVVISDQSPVGASGSEGASRRFLEFIGKVIAGLKTSGIGEVKSVVIPATAIRYVEISLDGRSYPIKIQTDRDPSSQVEDIVNMIKYLDKNSIMPNYVDVRVENRGYWQ
jgi:cell division septal protein FtsQ